MGSLILILVIIVVVGGLVAAIFGQKEVKKRSKVLELVVNSIPDFSPSRKIVGLQNLYIFAVDDSRNKIVYVTESSKEVINYEDVISVEKLEEGSVIDQKSTTRTIGGAIVGGVLAGGAGAVIGGLSGDSTQKKLHSSVKVKLLIRNNSTKPSIEINCFDCNTMMIDKKPVKEGSVNDIIYQNGIKHANEIVDIVSVIIDKVDKSSASNDTTQKIGNTESVAEELTKLASLKEKGLLSDEEFATQKAKILGM